MCDFTRCDNPFLGTAVPPLLINETYFYPIQSWQLKYTLQPPDTQASLRKDDAYKTMHEWARDSRV